MKRKLIELAALALFPLSGMAGVMPQKSSVTLSPDCDNLVFTKLETGGNVALKTRSTDLPEVITNPEGTKQGLINESDGFFVNFSALDFKNSKHESGLIHGSGNEVYIKNPVSLFPTDTYVKGELIDNQITVALPQCLGYQSGIDGSGNEVYQFYYVSLMECKSNGTEISYYEVAPEDNKVVYNVLPNGDIELKLNSDPYNVGDQVLPKYILGLSSGEDGTSSPWYGYGDAYQYLTPYDDTTVSLPEGAVVEEWCLSTPTVARNVNVAFVDNKLYLGNICDEMSGAWVEGTLKDGKILFECPQLMGFLSDYKMYYYGLLIYFAACEYDESDGENEGHLIDSFTMLYDESTKTLTMENPGVSLLCNGNTTDVYYIEGTKYDNPRIHFLTREDMIAKIRNPQVLFFSKYNEEWGEGDMTWEFPPINENGAILNTEDMYYNIYLDGELLTLTPDEYDVEEDLTDIPYQFTSYDIFIDPANASRHNIYFYNEIETFGVKLFCDIKEDGKVIDTICSDLITFDYSTLETTTGIYAITNNNDEIESVSFYDLQGNRISGSNSGLFIRVEKTRSGDVRTYKVVKCK